MKAMDLATLAAFAVEGKASATWRSEGSQVGSEAGIEKVGLNRVLALLDVK